MFYFFALSEITVMAGSRTVPVSLINVKFTGGFLNDIFSPCNLVRSNSETLNFWFLLFLTGCSILCRYGRR